MTIFKKLLPNYFDLTSREQEILYAQENKLERGLAFVFDKAEPTVEGPSEFIRLSYTDEPGLYHAKLLEVIHICD